MELYKNKEWLEKELKKRTSIAKEFNKDITTIRYWKKKFNITIPKKIKYPVREYQCPVCGITFKKRVTQKSQQIYCSSECAYKGRSLRLTIRNVKAKYNTSPTYIDLKCHNCGKVFTVAKEKKK